MTRPKYEANYEPQYELTDKGEREQRSHVTAKAHVEAGASVWLCYSVIYKGIDPAESPARRRVLAWALRHGYLKPKAKPRAADSIDAIDAELERARQNIHARAKRT